MKTEDSLIKKIWRAIYPALLLVVIYLAVYFIAMLIYDAFFKTQYASVDAFMGVCGEIVSTVALAAGFLVGWKLYKKDGVVTEWGRLKKPLYPVLLFAFGALASRALSIAVSFLGMLIQPESTYTQTGDILQGMGLVLTLIKLVILVPMAEELIFRGLVFRRLREFSGFWVAAVVSSVIFAVYHANLLQGIYAFLFGILLCIINEIFGTWWAGALVHAGANCLSVVLQALNVQHQQVWAYVVIMVGTGVIAAAIYIAALRKQ